MDCSISVMSEQWGRIHRASARPRSRAGAHSGGARSGGVRPVSRADRWTLAAGRGTRDAEACSRLTQPWLRGPSCECSLPGKLMNAQRHGRVGWEGGRQGSQGPASASSRARMCWNHSLAIGWLRCAASGCPGLVLDLSFSSHCFIGYPHVINRYRLSHGDLTFIRN